MADGVFPQNIDRAGIEVDLSRCKLPRSLELRYDRLFDGAIQQMKQIESGERVNVDENWQVGHYWLRNPSLVPDAFAEYRSAIDEVQQSIAEFHQDEFAGTFERILWIGIGGSALGPQLLYDVLRKPGTTPQMFFFDNTDPSGFRRTLQEIAVAGPLNEVLKKTLTVVVSKSGGTRETRNGMLVAQQEYNKAGLDFAASAVAVTKAGSKLDMQAKDEAWLARLPMWDWVGGRTSLFSAVGMLPATLLGFDVEQLMAGAKAMDDATRARSLDDNPALLLAASWYHMVEVLGLHNMVVLPYCDRLELFGKYAQQLIMESLGKNGKGITVYGNKGSTDQHSFVQQLRDGYPDFFVTFLRVLVPEDDWDVADGVTAGDYLSAFQEGTARALSEAGRPSLRITTARLDERSLGALVSLFERAVGYYGAMLGINTYHQPGVEAGKRAAEAIIAELRKGH